MTSCPKAQCLIKAVAVFAVISVFGFFFHHCEYMKNLYSQTPNLWRPLDEMRSMMSVITGINVVLAMAITCLYSKIASKPASYVCSTTGETKKCCPQKRAICYGLKVGIIMGLTQATFYAVLPISLNLAIAWLAGSIVEGLAIGMTLAAFCGKKSDCGATPAA